MVAESDNFSLRFSIIAFRSVVLCEVFLFVADFLLKREHFPPTYCYNAQYVLCF